METFSKSHALTGLKPLLYFMLAWVAVNLLQAALVGVDADEAYYWLYSRDLQWGYFDHPPLVAVLIKLGETLGHGSFYTRLATVLLSAGTVYFGFKQLPPRIADLRLYLLLFASVALFNVYSFIATPDGPLFFFAMLYFCAYRRYLANDSVKNVLLLAASIAGMFYSKYHGVLPVLFTVLSNPKLVLRPSAWAVVGLVTILFSPHLWWQAQHDWPTLRYHLSERVGNPYKASRTGDYIAGQLFVWGFFTTIPALYLFIKKFRSHNAYERAHQFTFWGVLGLFLLSSFRGNIEPHWTLVAGPSFLVLAQSVLHDATSKRKRLFTRLLGFSILLILVARIVIALPHSPAGKIRAFRALLDDRAWADSIYTVANGLPVVFPNSYRYPAVYQYRHPDAVAWGYNTIYYRKTQFNIFSDDFLNNATVYIASPDSTATRHFFKTPYHTLYLSKADSMKAVNALKIEWLNVRDKFHSANQDSIAILLHNTGKETISTRGLAVSYAFVKHLDRIYAPPVSHTFQQAVLPPGFKTRIKLPVQLPNEPGAYRIVFSMVQPQQYGTFASPFYKVKVE